MSVKLVGDTAFVTGAARGIGRACVEALLDAGCAHVYSADVASHEAPDGAEAVVLNVADAAAVDAFVSGAARPMTIVVNNAGIYRARNGLEIDDAEWQRTFEVISHGTFYCTRAASRRMIAERLAGAVINISSIAGKRAFAMQADYCAAKAAVLGFTRAAALDLAPHGITVNAICPGTIDTPMIRQVVADLAATNGIDEEEQRAALLRDVPIGRMQQPAEIAAGVVYLASEPARAVTGEALTIDGGLSRD
jgi:NAD(P)-dependent dehydrogenase (short-subunit alcohol dehydrogenase family)